MPNHLIAETSPYLRQHAGNPVDWYPWGVEAFERAAREEKPVFLSIGYSACHWCHVMAHESFENPEIAAILNEHFVSVKVDREERPDIDAIYMDAVTSFTGRGGWPMSVFLTPDALPFFGGTYFPPESRYGMPGFREVLQRVAELWRTQREELAEAGLSLKRTLERQHTMVAAPAARGLASEMLPAAPGLASETLEAAEAALLRSFDAVHGGWGGAPKFPQPAIGEFALRRALARRDLDVPTTPATATPGAPTPADAPASQLLAALTRTLDAMLRGGIYDQLGGGFHRYSVDDVWLVPHFEKMLYDNAQLARLYLHAWQVTGDDAYRRVVTGTLDYAAREMLDPSGGFYSAQDADSEGREGRFFVWTPAEIRAALQDTPAEVDADLFMAAFGVTDAGNFEGTNILSIQKTPAELAGAAGFPAAGPSGADASAESSGHTGSAPLTESEIAARLERARLVLLAARNARTHPGLDTKVLAGWNGLMLAAFAETARVLSRDDYRAVAERNAAFLLSEMRSADGRISRTWASGQAKLNGYLEDYAACAEGFLELYQTTFDPRWFTAARALADHILKHFADPSGGFFDTSDDHEALLFRPKTIQDGAIPSGASVAADVLVRLASYAGEPRYSRAAEAAVAQVQATAGQVPLGFARWLSVLDFALATPETLAIVGPDPREMLKVVWQRYRPNLLVAAGDAAEADTPELLRQHGVQGGRGSLPATVESPRSTAHLCRQFTCAPPICSAAELASALDLEVRATEAL